MKGARVDRRGHAAVVAHVVEQVARAAHQARAAGLEDALERRRVAGRVLVGASAEVRSAARNRARSGRASRGRSPTAAVDLPPSEVELHQPPVGRVVGPGRVLEAPVAARGGDLGAPPRMRADSRARRPPADGRGAASPASPAATSPPNFTAPIASPPSAASMARPVRSRSAALEDPLRASEGGAISF